MTDQNFYGAHISRRKNSGNLNLRLHEKMKKYIYPAKVREGQWLSSSELMDKLPPMIKNEYDTSQLGAYLTAARYVKKHFSEHRNVGPDYDGDYGMKMINKWRVGMPNRPPIVA